MIRCLTILPKFKYHRGFVLIYSFLTSLSISFVFLIISRSSFVALLIDMQWSDECDWCIRKSGIRTLVTLLANKFSPIFIDFLMKILCISSELICIFFL